MPQIGLRAPLAMVSVLLTWSGWRNIQCFHFVTRQLILCMETALLPLCMAGSFLRASEAVYATAPSAAPGMIDERFRGSFQAYMDEMFMLKYTAPGNGTVW